MNILVATCYVPFTHDRNARLARELVAELTRRGHRADAVLVPFHPDGDPAEQRLALRLLDLTEAAGGPVDRLIAIGEPATALRHPNLTAWYADTARPA
ncbi:MAG: glycosyltransferase family 4 protein, partial [Gemmataceae bacterium]